MRSRQRRRTRTSLAKHMKMKAHPPLYSTIEEMTSFRLPQREIFHYSWTPDIHTPSLPQNAMISHIWRHLHPEEHNVSTCKTMKDVKNRQKPPVNDRREFDKPLPEPDRSTSAIWRAPRKSRSKPNLCSRLSLEVARP